MPQRKSLLRLLAVLVALAAILILTHAWWLPGLAYALVRFDAPQPADAVVVLGGDGFGHRILKAAELVRNQYAPLVLVSGPEGFYGYNEAELAIAYAERAGYPASWFVAVPHPYSSTSGEAPPPPPPRLRPGTAPPRHPHLPVGHQRLPHPPRWAHLPRRHPRSPLLRDRRALPQLRPRRLVADPRGT